MAWLCPECRTCHKRGAGCPPQLTLEELQKESRKNLEKLLKQLDEAEKHTKGSTLQFDVDKSIHGGMIQQCLECGEIHGQHAQCCVRSAS